MISPSKSSIASFIVLDVRWWSVGELNPRPVCDTVESDAPLVKSLLNFGVDQITVVLELVKLCISGFSAVHSSGADEGISEVGVVTGIDAVDFDVVNC
jgi:hypothetical protein